MIRGLYTSASGMVAQMHRMDALANNLANVDLNGYKKDMPVHKAFPELLLRRMDDDGVINLGFGSIDVAPVVGKLGTGVELNESYTIFTQGALKQTDNPFDLALEGEGFLTVQVGDEERYTRNGAFLLSDDGFLVTKDGHRVIGENGPIRLKKNNFVIDQDGVIWQNSEYVGDETRLVSLEENEWGSIERVDRLKIVDFKRTRYLKKQGNSFWRDTRESGSAQVMDFGSRPKVRQGFLEGSNVNTVQQMVQMIEVNRTYEANQRIIQSHDSMLGKLINEAIRV